MNNKTLNLNDKRERITKAGSTMFIMVAIAAAIVAFCGVSIKFLWSNASYNNRIINAKLKAQDDLKKSASNLDSLTKQYPEIESTATNSKKILNALPPRYDYAALSASMQQLANQSGVSLSGSIGNDGSATAANESEKPQPQEIPLSITVTGSYQSITQFLQTLERSTRPIQVTEATYSGTGTNLKAALVAKTYYQPQRSLGVTWSTVQ